ncbi:hypothetical protein K3495_g1366 [Podosphaera aphanis]|nr:hypothetical protein K3495_g1366 [Podosphaera aphanis]
MIANLSMRDHNNGPRGGKPVPKPPAPWQTGKELAYCKKTSSVHVVKNLDIFIGSARRSRHLESIEDNETRSFSGKE